MYSHPFISQVVVNVQTSIALDISHRLSYYVKNHIESQHFI